MNADRNSLATIVLLILAKPFRSVAKRREAATLPSTSGSGFDSPPLPTRNRSAALVAARQTLQTTVSQFFATDNQSEASPCDASSVAASPLRPRLSPLPAHPRRGFNRPAHRRKKPCHSRAPSVTRSIRAALIARCRCCPRRPRATRARGDPASSLDLRVLPPSCRFVDDRFLFRDPMLDPPGRAERQGCGMEPLPAIRETAEPVSLAEPLRSVAVRRELAQPASPLRMSAPPPHPCRPQNRSAALVAAHGTSHTMFSALSATVLSDSKMEEGNPRLIIEAAAG